jgi:hypothetical protein
MDLAYLADGAVLAIVQGGQRGLHLRPDAGGTRDHEPRRVLGASAPPLAALSQRVSVRQARVASWRVKWVSGFARSWPEISAMRLSRYLSVLRWTARARAVA